MSIMNILGTAKTITVASALALALGAAAPASAAPASTDAGRSAAGNGSATCAKAASTTKSSTTMTLVRGQQARDLTDGVRSALRTGALSSKAPASALSFDDAKVYDVTSKGSTRTSVTVPVDGGYSKVSNLTVVLAADGSIEQSGETLITKNVEGNFTISSYTDGSLTRSQDTDRAYVSNEQLDQADTVAADTAAADTAAADEVAARGAGNTVACVAAVLGVSGVTAYLIVGACTGACTIPVVGTAICIACIGAYAAVGGASITAVASCF